jgi:antitoxin VapB
MLTGLPKNSRRGGARIRLKKAALENELRRLDQTVPLRERLRPLQNRVLRRLATGLEADKASYDDLSGNL